MKALRSKENLETLRRMIADGVFGIAIFTSTGIMATDEELKSKGVEFTKAPTIVFLHRGFI